MRRVHAVIPLSLALFVTSFAVAADWSRFRGPDGQRISDEKNLPESWTENDIAWKCDLPGPGASSPIVIDDNIYLTRYTGDGLQETVGDQQDLMRHLLCIDRAKGTIRWMKDFKPLLPEHDYQ